jgi:hypothetical protein
MIQSDFATTTVPVPCRIFESLEELSTSHFSHWKDSNNTLRATFNIIISCRVLGEESKVMETEDEMVRCRIEEKNDLESNPGHEECL